MAVHTNGSYRTRMRPLVGQSSVLHGSQVGFCGAVGVGFFHDVAGQHIGVEPDHGRKRLVASKSTGTGERWLLSRPNPLPTSSKQTRLARARLNCWRRALGMVTCSLLVIEPVLEAYTVENKHLLPGKTGGAGGQRRINAYFAADGGVELDMPDRRDLPTDLRRRFRIAELYLSGDWGVGLESFKADQERDRYQEAES